MGANWPLYGAYGFTGRLILAEALRRGHHPILAGRSPDKLRPLIAEAAVLAVERVVTGPLPGALTPAQAFGPDFVLHLSHTRRLEA